MVIHIDGVELVGLDYQMLIGEIAEKNYAEFRKVKV